MSTGLPAGNSGVTQLALIRAVRSSFTSAKVTQLALIRAVSNTTPTTPTPGGVNTGTIVPMPYSVHLDRKVRLTGSYATGVTTWTLPIDDNTLTTVVLASTAFGANNGKVLAGTYDNGTITFAGDYSAGPVIIGRPFTMTVELSRPYRRDQASNSVLGDRLQHSVQYFSHLNSGDYTVRATMPSPPTRADRTKVFSFATIGGVQEQGETRTLFSGSCEQLRIFVESALPRPVTISGIKYTVEVMEDQG